MSSSDALLLVMQRRMRQMRLIAPAPDSPEAVVQSLGAVQAQDYAAAKWAVVQRTTSATDADFEAAFARGAILRTHVLRPTWHLVAPADLRWMLQLTAPRVHAKMAPYYRQVGLDARTLARGDDVLAAALQGGKHLTRAELGQALRAAGIDGKRNQSGGGDNLPLTFLVAHAELEGAICSGPRRGKQFTYAALDERAPGAHTLPRDQALAELARRYFASHGPAQARELAWWSGLTIADAEAAIATLGRELEPVRAGDQTFWIGARSGSAGGRRARSGAATAGAAVVRLLPNYDEYLVSCRDHAGVLDPRLSRTLGRRESILSNHVVGGDGRVIGDWQRTLQRKQVTVKVQLVTTVDAAVRAALATEVERYARFLGLRAQLNITTARALKSRKSKD